MYRQQLVLVPLPLGLLRLRQALRPLGPQVVVADGDVAVPLVQRAPHVGGVEPALEAQRVGPLQAPAEELRADAAAAVLGEDEDEVEDCMLCIQLEWIDQLYGETCHVIASDPKEDT